MHWSVSNNKQYGTTLCTDPEKICRGSERYNFAGGGGGGGYDGLCKKIDFFKVSPFLIRPWPRKCRSTYLVRKNDNSK